MAVTRYRDGRDALKLVPEPFADGQLESLNIERVTMLLERGIRVVNVQAVGDAYAIAANYLRRTGAIPDTLATNERLLELIVAMFHHGESNALKLANKSITQFVATATVLDLHVNEVSDV